MMVMCLAGGLVVDPASGINKRANVYIDEGEILAVGNSLAGAKVHSTIEVGNQIVMPGLVDLGARLREPGLEHKATIASELKAAAAGGFVDVCATPDTVPAIDNASVVEHIRQRASRVRGARAHCLGALTANLEGNILAEMYALKESGCIAVTNLDQPISDTSVLSHALAYAASCDLKVLLCPYEHWLSQGGKIHEGKTSTRLGLPGIPSAAELIAVQRDLVLVEETGVTAHFCHISSAAASKLIAAAKKRGLPVSCDVAIANLLFDETDIDEFDGNYHIEPPLRTVRDRKQLTAGVKRNVVNAVSANHAPHDADAKLAPFSLTEPGISTFDTYFSNLYSLVRNGLIDLDAAVRSATYAPAEILGLPNGRLTVGAPADICVFDPSLQWHVSDETMLSEGKNTPQLNSDVVGKVTKTFIDGRLVYEYGS